MPLKENIKGLFKRKSSTSQEEENPIQQCLHKMEDIEQRLNKMQKRERRHAQLQEAMYEELNHRLTNLQNQISADFPFDSVYDFSCNFALYILEHSKKDPALQSLWDKFATMLTDLGAELVLDRGEQFDDSRHQVCDTRFDPDHPEGAILEVVQPGIKLQDELKKPAVVVVNKAPAEQ